MDLPANSRAVRRFERVVERVCTDIRGLLPRVSVPRPGPLLRRQGICITPLCEDDPPRWGREPDSTDDFGLIPVIPAGIREIKVTLRAVAAAIRASAASARAWWC